jgi:hypothetical protein
MATAIHLSVDTVKRSGGRSSVAAAAYRLGVCLVDDRTGTTHDYTRKAGVVASAVVLPKGAPADYADPATLWNAAEASETRKNSVTAREWQAAVPFGLSEADALKAGRAYATWLAERYGIAVSVAVHRDNGRDASGRKKPDAKRGFHLHMLGTTRQVGPEGFGPKTRVLDDKKTGPGEVEACREFWAGMCNALAPGRDYDHRSYKRQGLPSPPPAFGAGATARARRGQSSGRVRAAAAAQSRRGRLQLAADALRGLLDGWEPPRPLGDALAARRAARAPQPPQGRRPRL